MCGLVTAPAATLPQNIAVQLFKLT